MSPVSRPPLPPKRLKIASMDPRMFSRGLPCTDVVDELKEARSRYEGDTWVALHGFPSYVIHNLDRVRARATSFGDPRTPGLSVTASCCLSSGIEWLHGDPDIKNLIELKRKLDTAEGIDADDAQELSIWFRSFPAVVPDATGSGSKRQNITTSDDIKKEVAVLASSLGVTISTIAALSIVATLSTQPSTLREHSKLMEDAVWGFLKRVRLRCRVAKTLLRTIR